MMIIAVPKYKLDENSFLKKELFRNAAEVRDGTSQYEYIPKPQRFPFMISLLEKNYISYGIHAEKDWR